MSFSVSDFCHTLARIRTAPPNPDALFRLLYNSQPIEKGSISAEFSPVCFSCLDTIFFTRTPLVPRGVHSPPLSPTTRHQTATLQIYLSSISGVITSVIPTQFQPPPPKDHRGRRFDVTPSPFRRPPDSRRDMPCCTGTPLPYCQKTTNPLGHP